MEKEFLNYEQSLALKELGFNELCFDFYDNNKKLFYHSDNENTIHIGDQVNAPTFSQAFRWFRDKYGKHQTIEYDPIDKVYMVTVGYDYIDGYTTYEEAELACLKELIQLVKNK